LELLLVDPDWKISAQNRAALMIASTMVSSEEEVAEIEEELYFNLTPPEALD
jgi:hypothetical protein